MFQPEVPLRPGGNMGVWTGPAWDPGLRVWQGLGDRRCCPTKGHAVHICPEATRAGREGRVPASGACATMGLSGWVAGSAAKGG